MAALTNPRRESFVQNRAEGLPIGKAYMLAGFKVKSLDAAFANGSRLLRNAMVSARLCELQETLAEKRLVTRETLAAELDQAIELAHQLGQPSAAIAGIQAKANLFGLEAPNKNLNVNVSTNFNQMTDDELMFELASMLNEVRAAAGKTPIPLPAPPTKDRKH